MQNPNNTGTRFKRRKFRKGPGRRNIGKVAFKMVRSLRRDINKNIELKNQDSLGTFSGTIVTSAGTVVYVSNIGQGSNIGQRAGNRITLHSILMRVSVYPSTVNLGGNNLRMIVFQDRNNQGALPNLGDLLIGTDYTVNPLNALNTMRFRIISDRLYTVIADECVNDKIYIKLEKNRRILNPIQYVSTTTAIGSAGSGAIFWLLVSSDAVNGPLVTASLRLRFKDD